MKSASLTSSVNGVVVAAAGDVVAALDPFAFHLARALNRRGMQKVFYCDAERTLAAAKLTTSLSRQKSTHELKIRNSPAAAARVLTAIRALLADPGAATFKPIVVLIGSPLEQRRVLWTLITAGLRPRVLVVLHVDAASIPFRPETSDLFQLADLIVTESAFGARAVEYCCEETRTSLRRPIAIIPPPADSGSAARGRHSSAWQTRRSTTFGLLPDDLLIVCSAGHPWDHRAFLAMQIFRIFADGLYWTCARCHRITTFNNDEDLNPLPAFACSFCSATEGTKGKSWPTARLFVALESLWSSSSAADVFSWDVCSVRRALGIDARVFLEGDEGIAPADSTDTVYERLNAADIHLAPHHVANLESALLAGCAMGVPTIATRFGAAAELLGSGVRLVEPAALHLTSEGHWTATMDAGEAVSELIALAENSAAREALGAAALDAARRLSWETVGNLWFDHVGRLGSSVESACTES